jgi:hypothetical protein
MGNGSVRLVAAVAAVVAAAAAVKVDADVDVAAAAAAVKVDADVDVDVAEVVPGKLAAEAVPEADSSNTGPSSCYCRRPCSVRNRRSRYWYLSW